MKKELLAQEMARAEGRSVAGIITEPIQSESGECHGSPAFVQGLARITRVWDIFLMRDMIIWLLASLS